MHQWCGMLINLRHPHCGMVKIQQSQGVPESFSLHKLKKRFFSSNPEKSPKNFIYIPKEIWYELRRRGSSLATSQLGQFYSILLFFIFYPFLEVIYPLGTRIPALHISMFISRSHCWIKWSSFLSCQSCWQQRQAAIIIIIIAVKHTHTHTQSHRHTPIHSHTHTHTPTHSHRDTYSHNQTRTQTLIQKHTHSHTHTHKHTHAHTHNHTHTEKFWCSDQRWDQVRMIRLRNVVRVTELKWISSDCDSSPNVHVTFDVMGESPNLYSFL